MPNRSQLTLSLLFTICAVPRGSYTGYQWRLNRKKYWQLAPFDWWSNFAGEAMRFWCFFDTWYHRYWCEYLGLRIVDNVFLMLCFFTICGWFSWFPMVFSWFFIVSGWYSWFSRYFHVFFIHLSLPSSTMQFILLKHQLMFLPCF